MTTVENGWTESDSQLYQDIARVAVPARAEQIATLLTLLPFKQDEAFRAVEIGCGEGIFSFTLLDCFGQAEVIALDGSAEMRAQANERLSRFDGRARVEPFDLAKTGWHAHLQTADCVISSLCLHHLDAQTKQALFTAICERLSRRGALLIADLVEPQRPEARELFATTWDRAAESQSTAETGSAHLFEKFVETKWNYYRFDDPADQPSPLFEQLRWLKAAGFEIVDCFWLQAGHAIYGGYKSRADKSSGDLTFISAFRFAQIALGKSIEYSD